MDIQVENFLLNTSNDQSSGIWKITRALKTAGWRYKASSDATTQEATGNPNNDKWGGGVQVGAQTATVSFTIGTPTTTSYGGRSTITGLTGFATTSVGHFLKITGATNSANDGTWLITKFNSATSVDIENPAAIAETTPGTATWTELSALLDTFPTLGTGAWWCGQGPSTMKVPIGASIPSGTFIRGENVTQTTSGATGEFLGVVTDSNGQGYLVIAPRLSGTGGGPRGWSTDLITGARSSATVTPSATVREFVREIVFWRNTTTLGHIYFQVIDQASEATTSASGTGRFSTMASTLTTTTICPGGATGLPTTNGFPVYGSYSPQGQGGSGAVTTGSQTWVGSSIAVNLGKSQILCANCIEDSGVSQDGTFIWAAGTPSVATTSFAGWGYFRVDEQEDGDVDPYVWYFRPAEGSNSRTRTVGNASNGSGDVWQSSFVLTNGSTPFIGWRRRGYQSGGVLNGDSWQELQAWWVGNTTGAFGVQNAGTPETVACTFVTTKPREPIWIAGWYAQVGNSIPINIRKGTLRWMYVVQGNAGTDTYDTKRWIQLSSVANPMVVGPADGTTTPVNQ